MFLTVLIIVCCYASIKARPSFTDTDMISSLPGSPWNTGESDYYYDVLTPEETLPVITTQSQTFTVDLGDSVLLPCDVEARGEFSLTWRRAEEILWILREHSDESFVKVTSDPRVERVRTSLKLNDVQAADQNTYICEVSTQPPRTLDHSLSVRVPPSVYPAHNRSVVIIKMGSTVTLVCHASGNPMPNITWSLKGGSLPGPVDRANLTVVKARPEDNGQYKCTADNGVGQPASTTITLQVMHPPKVREEKKEVYTGVNFDATLACFVDAEPQAQVKWYRVGDIPVDPLRLIKGIDTNKRYSLQFERVQLDDFGYYTCNASNYMGNSSAVVHLSGRPKPVRYFSSTQGDKNTSYTLVWDVVSYAPILTYSIAYRNESDMEDQWVNFTVPGTTSSSIYHSKSHTFTQLDPGATYYVKVSAKNEFGESDINETFSFTTFNPVSEVDGDSESQGLPTSVTGDAETSAIPRTEGEEIHLRKKAPTAESAAVQDDSSSAVTFTMTPAEKRAQMIALVTAISLSCFFL
ncbi:protein amalgam-like isoform X7 [Panulirus ornatus]|uniref:protein amalgam-like isoform X7 n=1 Tax=Panulirus ornatus TaxID=150431 RepID=UPI003A841A06